VSAASLGLPLTVVTTMREQEGRVLLVPASRSITVSE